MLHLKPIYWKKKHQFVMDMKAGTTTKKPTRAGFKMPKSYILKYLLRECGKGSQFCNFITTLKKRLPVPEQPKTFVLHDERM